MAGINTATMATLFRVDQNTIKAWARSGMPVAQEGTGGAGEDGGHKFDLQDCVRWYFTVNYERVTGERIKNRLAATKLAEAEAKAAVDASTTYPASVVEELLTEVFVNFRANILAIPTKIAAQLAGKTIAETKDTLASELAKLADGLATGFDFSKAKADRPVPEAGAVGEATAEDDGEPMGGLVQEAV